MVYFRVEGFKKDVCTGRQDLNRVEQRAYAGELCEKSTDFFQKSLGKELPFIVSMRSDKVVAAIALTEIQDAKVVFERFLSTLDFELESYTVDEITFKSFTTLMVSASRSGYVWDEDDVIDSLGLSDISHQRYGFEFKENIISGPMNYNETSKISEDLFFSDTLTPELERIFEGSSYKRPNGHPVHYLVFGNNFRTSENVCRTLLSALLQSGRIKNKRYSVIGFNDRGYIELAALSAIYRTSEGGAVILKYNGEAANDGEFGTRGNDLISIVSEIACRYKNKVLTIICIKDEADKAVEEFYTNFGSTAFVKIKEDVICGDAAIKYLQSRARANNISSDKKLINIVSDAQHGYTANELNLLFENWYDQKLRNNIYPQYKNVCTAMENIKSQTPRGSAYEQLQELIGLTEAKAVMDKALNYFKVQKMFAARGLNSEMPSMHMVFTGNPGTAKTTVARLFAQIMKENNLLANGEIYEVGRADLVGKFVGHTAPLVKKAFKRAKGGVLFIDEAYSLVDDRDGMFGDEAINTIVQEMENNRKDTVVIFAGYPDKMEKFLNKNPGLRSRIAFHIPFADYNETELCSIAQLIAKEKSLKLEDKAIIKLKEVFAQAALQSDFGNGRYARNVIEKAKMAQATRIVNMNFDDITDDEIITIKADDIEDVKKVPSKVIKLGFSA